MGLLVGSAFAAYANHDVCGRSPEWIIWKLLHLRRPKLAAPEQPMHTVPGRDYLECIYRFDVATRGGELQGKRGCVGNACGKRCERLTR